MNGMSAPDGVDADFRQADVAHVARLHQIGNGSDRFLDGNRGVETSGPIDVDDLDAEPLETVSGERFHGRGPRIDAEPTAVRSAQRTELHRDLRAAAEPG